MNLIAYLARTLTAPLRVIFRPSPIGRGLRTASAHTPSWWLADGSDTPPAPAPPNYQGALYAAARRDILRQMTTGRTVTVPQMVVVYLENFLVNLLQDDRIVGGHYSYDGMKLAAMREALTDGLAASPRGPLPLFAIGDLTPPAALYNRDDVDESALGQLAVLAQVRTMVVDYHPVTSDPLADVIAIVDAVALSLAPDDDFDDDQYGEGL